MAAIANQIPMKMSAVQKAAPSRRKFVRLVAAASISAPSVSMAQPTIIALIGAFGEPSEFLKMSPTWLSYYTRYRLPLYLLEPHAKAAWRMQQRLRDTSPHLWWAKDDFDYWITQAGMQLGRARSLMNKGSPEAFAGWETIIDLVGEDVFAEYLWGQAQPPVHYREGPFAE